MIEFTQSISNTLLDPQILITAAQEELRITKEQLEKANSFESQLDAVLEHIYVGAKGDALPDDANKWEMCGRIVELVMADDRAVWTPEREFQVTVTFNVTLTGTVKARTSKEAEQKVYVDEPTLSMEYSGALDQDDEEFDYSIDSVEVDA